MIPYITNRGGPMVGLEALSMQGLPVDKLLLTRESEDQLADLAGNAMSTTVVGACILAALVTGKKLLKLGGDSETYEDKHGGDAYNALDDSMEVEANDIGEAIPSQVVGEDRLTKQPLDLSNSNDIPLAEILFKADRSKRLCSCEGRDEVTTRQLFRCSDCSGTFCKKCGGRPEHNPVEIDVAEHVRLHPADFAKKLKSTLPMCISLTEITQGLMDSLREKENLDIPEKRWVVWRDAVVRVAASELRFVELRRQDIWAAIYQSPFGKLELSLHPQQPEWRLYAEPEPQEPANAEIRQLLQSPVGRFACSDGLLEGRWFFAFPTKSSISIAIRGVGELVPSWEARLGLTSEEFKNKLVYSEIQVTVSPDDVPDLERDISGKYVLLDKCGTANGALHKRLEGDENSKLPPLFMLFDPHRTNDSEDCFVFSISTRRIEYQECRPIVCKLDPSWRQSSREEEEAVICHLPFKWVHAPAVQLQVSFVSLVLNV